MRSRIRMPTAWVTFTIVAADEVRAWRFPIGAFVDFKEQNHTFEDMIGLVYREIHYVSRGGTEESSARG